MVYIFVLLAVLLIAIAAATPIKMLVDKRRHKWADLNGDLKQQEYRDAIEQTLQRSILRSEVKDLNPKPVPAMRDV